MSFRILPCLLAAAAVACGAFAPAAAADPDAASGGAAAPNSVELAVALCANGQQWACLPGQRLVLRGEGLTAVERVDFLGARGTRDDRRAAPVSQTAHELVVVVPSGSRTGRLRAKSSFARSALSTHQLRIKRPAAPTAAPGPAAASGEGVFPIAGRHDLGQSETNNFGGGRGHQGQDLFAACGTPLVSPVAATVSEKRTDGTAGNYLVLQDAAGQSYVFMHMRDPALVSKGGRVTPGQKMGYVGESGNAQGCHLHFEIWAAPGWYQGGKAIDPLPTLKAWDEGHSHR